jgi:hypothetical protein
MKELPTIKVIGYDVDLSWVSLVKAALTEADDQSMAPAEDPVIIIPGALPGPYFVVTLKPLTRPSNEKLLAVKPDPHGPDDIVLLVPGEPIDPLQQRTGWLRKEILEAITLSIKPIEQTPAPQPPQSSEEFVDDLLSRINSPTPQHNFTIYFHPDLSKEQIEKSFAALADYYRACGGTGFRVQFEEQNVRVPEVVYDGRW